MEKFMKANLLIGDQEINTDLLAFYFEMIEQRVMNYCHIPEIPPELENIIIQMVVAFWETKHPAVGDATAGKEISSIQRGDTTISYRTESASKSGGGSLDGIDAFVNSYYKQLYPFRRLVSPS